jgi:hypothetical protein
MLEHTFETPKRAVHYAHRFPRRLTRWRQFNWPRRAASFYLVNNPSCDFRRAKPKTNYFSDSTGERHPGALAVVIEKREQIRRKKRCNRVNHPTPSTYSHSEQGKQHLRGKPRQMVMCDSLLVRFGPHQVPLRRSFAVGFSLRFNNMLVHALTAHRGLCRPHRSQNSRSFIDETT